MNEQPWKWQLFGCFVCSEASICNFPQKMSIWLWEQGAKLLLASLGQVVKRVNDMYCQENIWYTKEKLVGKTKKGFWNKSSPCWPRLPLFIFLNTLKIIIFYNTKFYFNIFQKVWKSTIIRSQSWYFLIFQKACWFGAQQTLLSKLCRKESTQKRCSGLTKSKKERKFTNIYFQG